MELIAWISKAYTPTYPIVKIQDFCFSTRKPFGIKWILHLCPSPHFFRQAFLGEKRAKCSTNLYRGLTQFSFVFVAKGKWQHLIISSGINQTQRSKPWTKKTEQQDLNFSEKMKVSYRNLKLEVKVWCWDSVRRSRTWRESKGRGTKMPVMTILLSLFHPSLNPQIWATGVTPSCHVRNVQ